MVAGHLKGR